MILVRFYQWVNEQLPVMNRKLTIFNIETLQLCKALLFVGTKATQFVWGEIFSVGLWVGTQALSKGSSCDWFHYHSSCICDFDLVFVCPGLMGWERSRWRKRRGSKLSGVDWWHCWRITSYTLGKKLLRKQQQPSSFRAASDFITSCLMMSNIPMHKHGGFQRSQADFALDSVLMSSEDTEDETSWGWGQMRRRLAKSEANWGWCQVRIGLAEGEFSWGWDQLRMRPAKGESSWGWYKLRVRPVEAETRWGWDKVRAPPAGGASGRLFLVFGSSSSCSSVWKLCERVWKQQPPDLEPHSCEYVLFC